ncbi:hypothetical protein [Duganella violaceipulchra]|uniref:Uncharacterized protein n=1 Tax=Duganella violaceipulchra TaxID=2849652 RepID=A0AA41H7X0_9BURK|nr:hypothetical protein [Duganella violaceicalia]MBV6323737.1 hypothetical protein [Duganella violaceicalia]MCP2007423.1 hypothetical protein [Duganella violaceicalia]
MSGRIWNIRSSIVFVRMSGDELVAALPDGRQVCHTGADELANMLLAEGVAAEDVRMPDWHEGGIALSTVQKLAIWSRMRAAGQR